jgi:PAS domain S-box-containing protein
VIYHLTDSTAIDPLWARFGLAGITLALLILSYQSDWIRDHFIPLAQSLFYTLTAYFVGVTILNDFAPDYALGVLLSISAIGVGFSLGSKSTRPLLLYLGTSTLMCVAGVAWVETPEVSPAIMSISICSISLVIFIAARAKIQAEELALTTEKRYQYVHTLINAANDAIFIANPNTGQLVEVNRKAQDLVGRSLDELRDMQLAELFPEGERDHYATLFNRHVRDKKPASESLHVEHRNGDHIPVDVSASLIDVEGTPLIQGIFRDATEQKRYEKQLIEAKERAEELLKLKSSFLNNMSHELRTPLTSILGYAEVLLEEKADNSQRMFAERIVDSAKRLQGTLNSVLDLAQLESGETTLELEVADVSDEVKDAVDLLKPVAQKKGLTLETAVTASDPYAKVDVACINRITNNLVGNAIKFTEDGRVTVEVGTDDEFVFLQVEDTGIGIEKQFLDHLFDEFRQESTGLQRTHEGSGLGLAITKRLVDLLGGRIEVASEKGKGSAFTVYLPRVAPSQAPEESATEPPSTTDLSFSGSVLVVEDNPLTRELISHQLGAHCEVELAEGPEAALDLARGRTFDLVMLDIHLGTDMNGVDLLRDLRDLPHYANVPAIALTAYALPADRERFFDGGFNLHLSKPFTKEELFETIIQAQEQSSPVSPPSRS